MKPFFMKSIASLLLVFVSLSAYAQSMEGFAWNYDETDSYGYPVVTICVGESHKLQYTYSTSTLSDPFNPDYWVYYELKNGVYTIVDEPTVFSISSDGVITGLKEGKAQLKPTYRIQRAEGTDRLSIIVVNEFEEDEYNNEFSYANNIHDNYQMRFRLSSSSDVDIFKFNTLATPYMYFTVEYLGESWANTSESRSIRYEVYDNNISLMGSGTLSFNAQGEKYRPMMRMVGYGSFGYIKFYYPSDHSSYFFPNGYFSVLATADDPTSSSILVTDITLDLTTLTLEKGQQYNLNATISPSDATNKVVSWTSSNTSVASVDEGLITAISEGTANIIAKTTDGSNLSASCKVTVTDSSSSNETSSVLRINFLDGTSRDYSISDIENIEFVESDDVINSGNDFYTIKFNDSPTGEDNTQIIKPDVSPDSLAVEGAEFISCVAIGEAAPTTRTYFGRTGYGLKLGNSSTPGNLLVLLTSKGQVKATSIVVKAAPWWNADTGRIDTPHAAINGFAYEIDDTETALKEYKIKFDEPQFIDTLFFSGTDKGRCFVKSVTVYY